MKSAIDMSFHAANLRKSCRILIGKSELRVNATHT